MAATATKSAITLKGSVEIVTEFFGYSINSILYQRGIYPPESFSRVSEYGLTMLVSTDPGLMEYFKNVLGQMAGLACPALLSFPTFSFRRFFLCLFNTPHPNHTTPPLLYSRLVGKWQRAKTHSCCDWCGYERSARKMGF